MALTPFELDAGSEKSLEDTVKVSEDFLNLGAVHDDVIEISQCDPVFEPAEDSVHEALERAWCADQAEGHVYPFPMRRVNTGDVERGLLLRALRQLDVVVPLLDVQGTEKSSTVEGVQRIIDAR